MIFAIQNNGRLLTVFNLPQELSAEAEKYAPGAFQVPADTTINEHYFDGSVVRPIPPQPGSFYKFHHSTGKWVLDVEAAWSAVKAERNRRLLETDWLMLRAAETGVPVNSAWLDYRKALRDITEQADPNNIVWPLVPESV